MVETNKAQITIDSKTSHTINPNIYGHFMEEIGNCIYNGIWSYSSHLQQLAMVENNNDAGHLSKMRTDVFNAIHSLVSSSNNANRRKSILRWPGGCFSDVYHWKNGIGPRETRPFMKNEHWNSWIYRLLPHQEGKFGPDVPNQFGTDEFCALCEKIGIEPFININYGSGTPEEAAEWVEYLNGDKTTYWGQQRTKIHVDPYKVKYFGIANEIWGKYEKGHPKSPEEYGTRYISFAKAMKSKDPNILLVACGLDPLAAHSERLVDGGKEWNKRLLPIIKDYVDYVSLHLYLPDPSNARMALSTSASYAYNERTYWSILASPILYEHAIDRVWNDIISCYGHLTPVRIALDEWGLWYYLSQVIKTNYTLMDGIWTASVLNLLQRKGNIVEIANWAQLINCIGLILTDAKGIIKTPPALAFECFWKYSQSEYLPTHVKCASFLNRKFHQIPQLQTPFIDASVTQSPDQKTLTISIVNKHFSEPSQIEIQSELFKSASYNLDQRISLSDENPFVMNTPGNRNAVEIKIHSEGLHFKTNDTIQMELPAHSFEILILRKKK